MKNVLGLLVIALLALGSCSNDYEEGEAGEAAVDATVEVGSDIGEAVDAMGEATVDAGAAVVDFVDGDDDSEIIEDEADGVDDGDTEEFDVDADLDVNTSGEADSDDAAEDGEIIQD